MTNDLCETARIRVKDWAVSASLHFLLVAGAGWGLSQSVAEMPAYKPLDLAVGWEAEAAPAPEQVEPVEQVTPPSPPPVMPKQPPAPMQKPASRSTPTPAPPATAPVAQPEPVQPMAPDAVAPVANSPPASAGPDSAPPADLPSAEPAEAAASVSKASGQPRWQAQLESLLAKYKRYPRIGQRMRQEGVVTVEAHFSATGEVVRCMVVRTSGFKVLDEAAIQLVQQAANVARSHHQPGRMTELRIPVVYELKES